MVNSRILPRYAETSKPFHSIEDLYRLIHNEKHLKNITGFTHDNFKFLLNEIAHLWKKDPNAPLCTEDELDNRGNRCKPPQRHVVLLTLERLRQNVTQSYLSSHHGVDQGTISRYLDYYISLMREFLPTGTNISKYLRTCTREKLERSAPEMEIIIDGT